MTLLHIKNFIFKFATVLLTLAVFTSLLSVLPTFWESAAADDPEPPSEITLAVTNSPFSTTQSATLTATLDTSVPSGQSIYIWDTTTNDVVGYCTTGDTCVKTTSFITGSAHTYVAYTTSTSGGPSSAILSSNAVTAERLAWQVTLTTDKAQFETNSPATLTATVNQSLNYNSYGYSLQIVDQSNSNTVLQTCDTGTTCTATVDYTLGSPRNYVARVMPYYGSTPEVSSDVVQVERTPWQVTLVSDKAQFTTNSPATLTATVNQPLNYYNYGYSLQIVDQSNSNTVLNTCYSGTTCTAIVDYTLGPVRNYVARVMPYYGSTPDASSTQVQVERAPWEILLEADVEDFDTQNPATLTATLNQPLNANNYGYRLDIVDLSNNNVLNTCYTGTTCTATVNFTLGAPREHVARIVPYSANTAEEESNIVLVSRTAWNVTLSSNKSQFPTDSPATLTATTNQPLNANNYGYRLDIVDLSNNNVLATCSSGTVCQATVDFKQGPIRNYVARIMPYSSSNEIEASSNQVQVERLPWEVSLATDKTLFATNSPATLTATINQPLNANNYGYRLDIVDLSNNTVLATCSTGVVCTATVNFTLGPARNYVARVIPYSSSSEIEKASNQVQVARLPWVVSLTTDKLWFRTDEVSQITATTNQPLNANNYGYRLDIVDLTTNTQIQQCYSGSTCTVNAKFYTGQAHQYVARIMPYYSSLDIEKQTRALKLARTRWSVDLQTSSGYLVATANQPASANMSYGAYGISIWDTGSNTRLVQCTSGSSCSYPAPSSGGPYLAVVDNAFGADAQANSDGFVADTGRPRGAEEDTAGGGNPAANGCGCPEGDPVNTGTGEFYENYNDISIPGRTPLVWSRSYSSAKVDVLGPFGYGWSGLGTVKLQTPYNDGSVQIVQENGSISEFDYDAVDNQYKAPDNVIATLKEESNGNWIYTRRHLEILIFNPSGQLIEQSTVLGNTITYTRDSAGKITSISSDSGEITLDYSGGLVASATTGDNRSVTYTYNEQSQLTAVTDLRGKTWKYFYNDAGLVDQIENPRGDSMHNTYDMYSRVTEQIDPEGGVSTFSYSGPPTDTTLTVRFTDAAGRVVDYTYDNGWLFSKTIGPTSTHPRTWTFIQGSTGQPVAAKGPNQVWTYSTYDTHGNRTSYTNEMGKTTSWQYNDLGQITSVLAAGITEYTNTYDSSARITSATRPITDTVDATTHFYYDDAQYPSDVTRVKDALGNTSYYTYNARGLRTSSLSAEDRKITYTYNPAGLLATQTSPRGNEMGAIAANYTTSYVYDDAGLVLSKTNGDNEIIEFTYNATGDLHTITDSSGATTTTQYDKNGHIISVTDDAENTTTYQRDEVGELLKEVDPTGAAVERTFDAYGEVATAVSPQGAFVGATQAEKEAATTTYLYNSYGELTGTSTPNPGGGDPIETEFTYDAAGRVLTVTDAEDNVTSYTYTDLGQLATVTIPGGGITTYGYNAAGWVTSVEDAVGRTTTFTYGKLGQTKTVVNNAGEKIEKTYTADGLLESIVDPRGFEAGAVKADYTTEYLYDSDSNLIKVTDPLDNFTEYTYDNLSQLDTVTSAEGAITDYGYNGRGLLTSVENPDEGLVQYHYNNLGLVTWQKDAELNQTSFTYDGANRVATKTDPLLRSWSWEYTTSGLLDQETSGEGTVDYAYDSLGRLTEVDYSDNTPDVSYTYNRNHQRASMADGDGTVSYTYNNDGAISSTTRGQDEFVYTWDQAGNLLSSSGPNGVVDYDYNDAGRVETMTADALNPAGGKTFTYGYTAAGQLESILAANGVYTTREYDRAGRLTEVDTQYTDGREESRLWDLNAIGAPTALTVTKTPSSSTSPLVDEYSWLYDENGRLTVECLAITCSPGAAHQSWEYDSRGAITSHVTATESIVYSHDDAGQLTTAAATNSSGTVTDTFTYDGNGNMLTGAGRTNTWNLAGQLTSTTTAAATNPVTYTYDGDGNRSSETTIDGVGVETTEFIWDIVSSSMPMLAVDAGVEATNKHVWHPNGSPAMVASDTGTNLVDTYFELDNLSSVVAESNSGGVQGDTFAYDPFGARRTPGPVFGRMGHNGQQQDATGLTYLRARYYDPALGVFLSPDPIEGAGDSYSGQSLFAYANNNPLMYVDPTGHCGALVIFASKDCADLNFAFAKGIAGGVTDTFVFAKDLTEDAWNGETDTLDEMLDGLDNAEREEGMWGVIKYGTPVGDVVEVCEKVKEGDLEGAAESLGGGLVGFLTRKPNIKPDTSKTDATGGNSNDKTDADTCETYKSFTADTLVLMADGSRKRIADIRVGDKVLAYNPKTGIFSEQVVTRLWVHEDVVLNLNVSNSADAFGSQSSFLDGYETISTTADHPFYSVSRAQWVQAGELVQGESLLAPLGGRVTVKGAQSGSLSPPEKVLMWNLSVTGPHTYFVGSTDVLVHNCNDAKKKQLAENRIAGRAAEAQYRQDLINDGVAAGDIFEQITVKVVDPSNGDVVRTRIDFYVRGRGFIEVKASQTAPKTANQKRAFKLMETQPFTPVGQKARDAGFNGDSEGATNVHVHRY